MPAKNVGRSNAVDIVVDAKNDAPQLRVAKHLDEAPLMALMERPNLITAAALREVAHSLSKFAKAVPRPISVKAQPPPQELNNIAERVFRHHARLAGSASDGAGKLDALAPLVAGLRRSSSSPDVLKSILKHPTVAAYQSRFGRSSSFAASADEPVPYAEGGNDNGLSKASTNLEMLIHEAVRDGSPEAILIAALAVLATCVKNLEEEGECYLQSTMGLRVGSILALLPVDDLNEHGMSSKCTPWNNSNEAKDDEESSSGIFRPPVVSSEMLKYMLKEAVSYEKAREEHESLTAQYQTKQEKESNRASNVVTPTPVEDDAQASPLNLTFDLHQTGEVETTSIDSTQRDSGVMPHEGVSAVSTVDQSVSNLQQDTSEMLTRAAYSDEGDNYVVRDGQVLNETERYGFLANHEDEAKFEEEVIEENGESSDDEEDDEESFDDDYDELDDYDEEAMLQEALALSLIDNTAVEQDDQHNEDDQASADSPEVGPECDGNESEWDEQRGRILPETEFDPSSSIDYTPNPSNSPISADFVKNGGLQIFDARDCMFGMMSVQQVLLYLLRSVYFMVDSCDMEDEDVSEDVQALCPGGIGASLFPYENTNNDGLGKRQRRSSNSPGTLMNLLIALLTITSDCRNNALESLAMAQAVSVAMSADISDSGPKESEDPADIYAIKTVREGDNATSILAAKGMHRKAAAAAESLALRQREEEKRIFDKSMDAMFLSYASLFVIRCMKKFQGNLSCHGRSNDSRLQFPDFSRFTTNKLASSLEKFYDHSFCESYQTVLSLHKEFRAVELCNEAIGVWGITLPLLYPTHGERQHLLQSFLDLNWDVDKSVSGNDSISTIDCIPWCEREKDQGLFEALCERLRYKDLLAFFFAPSFGDTKTHDQPAIVSSLARFESLLCTINRPNVSAFYFALVYRANLMLLLRGTEGYDWSLLSSIDRSEFGTKLPSLNSGRSLMFDSSRCSDSVAIKNSSDGYRGASALQRASKVWGTVLSDTAFSPKTGVHRFVVRLDHCEKGHIFVGVATAEASTKTYVGGDRYGYGLIGTQALWHDRSKIRSDYGSAFRTSDVIIVTLDTNNGSLSFGVLKESRKEDAAGADSGGNFEDWGIAFEGLPMDTKLFPAVGLYQRDDKVTLLSLVGSPCDVDCYPNSSTVPDPKSNQIITSDGLMFALDILIGVIKVLKRAISLPKIERELLLKDPQLVVVLPSLAASICTMAKQPFSNGFYAMSLLPILSSIAKLLDVLRHDDSVDNGSDIIDSVVGKWIIRASSPDGTVGEAYSLEIEAAGNASGGCYGIVGRGKGVAGKSKGGIVDIRGSVDGSRLRFVEVWKKEADGVKSSAIESSCIVDTRVGLYGNSFEGKYATQSGQSRAIAGRKKDKACSNDAMISLDRCEVLVCLAISHLTMFLSGDQMESDMAYSLEHENLSKFSWIRNDILRGGLASDDLFQHMRELQGYYVTDVFTQTINNRQEVGDMVAEWSKLAWSAVEEVVANEKLVEPIIIDEALDNWVAPHAGADGSLSRFASEEFRQARRLVVSALLYHISICDKVYSEYQSGGNPSDEVKSLWRGALTIMEAAVRRSMSELGPKKGCIEACKLVTDQSNFLRKLRVSRRYGDSKEEILTQLFDFYKDVVGKIDLDALEADMALASKKSLLRMIGLASLRILLASSDGTYYCASLKFGPAIESSLAMLPLLLRRKYSTDLIRFGDFSAQNCWNSEKHRLYSIFGNLLQNAAKAPIADGDYVSLALCLFSCWTMVIQPKDYELIRQSEIMKSVKHMLFSNLKVLDETCSNEDDMAKLTRQYSIRKVLKASWAATHVLLAQLSPQIYDSASVFEVALEDIKEELICMIEMVKDRMKSRCEADERDLSEKEVEMWSQECLSSEQQEKMKLKKAHNNDVQDLSSLHLLLAKDYQKAGLNDDRSAFESSVSLSCDGPDAFLLQMLTLINTLVKSPPCRKRIIELDLHLVLLRSLGVSVNVGGEENEVSQRRQCFLPSFLGRKVLRLLRWLLPYTPPDKSVVRCLLVLSCGEENLISLENNFASFRNCDRELAGDAVTLLRILFLGKKNGWCDIILGCVASIEKKKLEAGISPHNRRETYGCLAFFGGAPNIVSPGNHVLINSETLRAKNSSTGSRVEEIVRGISCRECSSGVVSNIDFSNGTCEVVLLAKRIYDKAPEVHEVKSKPLNASMSVRAVRVSLEDVSAVDEFPLVLHDAMVESCAFRLSQAVDNQHLENTSSKEGACVYSVMALRGALLVLSDKNILLKYLKSPYTCMGKVLEIAAASCGDVGSRNLASVSQHEKRYLKLLSLLCEVRKRRSCVAQYPPDLIHTEESLDLCEGISVSSGDGNSVGRAGSDSNMASTSGAASSNVATDDGGESVSTTDTNHEQQPSDDDIQAAIAQMAELGLPRAFAELALRRTGGANVEAAVHYCLERSGEMEHILAEEISRENRRGSGGSNSSGVGNSSHLVRQLLEMGFPSHWCAEALAATRNNVDEALTWILTNSDRLSELDSERLVDDIEDDDEDDSETGEDDEGDAESNSDDEGGESSQISQNDVNIDEQASAKKQVCLQESIWTDSICPLQFVSGRSKIDSKTFEISGLPTSGFSSVGTKGILHSTGKWYYEVELLTAGCLQIGWADGSFAGHCQADRGVGDGPSSWAYDGWRRYRWHATATEWGSRWQVGDIIGCAVDLDEKIISFTLNGKGEEIGMGLAFSGDGFRHCGGVYACVSFNRKERLKMIIGGGNRGSEQFHYGPPKGYRGVGEAVLEAVDEMNLLMRNENKFLGAPSKCSVSPLCDFSDGEHGHELFAWQHRYYGSDASVHLASGKSRVKDKHAVDKEEEVIDRVKKAWKKMSAQIKSVSETKQGTSHMQECYAEVESELKEEIQLECQSLCILYSRKLILQIMTTLCEDNFDINDFVQRKSNENEELIAAQRLWKTVEVCCGLRVAGWVGEAGAMAVAAEALGLGISSNDGASSSCQRGNMTHMLTAAFLVDGERDSSRTIAASSEAAFSGLGGGGLVFIRAALQSACSGSIIFRSLVLASIQRSVRVLASVEMKDLSEEDENEETFKNAVDDFSDSRLTLFLTGLLVSDHMRCGICPEEWEMLVECLVESWSVGLLSGSAPWRMISALTCAGLFHLCTLGSFEKILQRLPTVRHFYMRLESTVSRRMWAERAATPVTSRYVQALIELLSSVKICGWEGMKEVSVDAATPIQQSFSLPDSRSWETDGGLVSSDEGWNCWLGVVECMSVEWMTPSRSTVRALMDEGEGPPMLREGCIVCRGVDWNGSNDDGRNDYDVEKAAFKEKYEVAKADPAEEKCADSEEKQPENDEQKSSAKKKNKRKIPHPKLPIGTVVSVEPWGGMPGLARRVRWHRTEIEEIHRFGGDGGRFDIAHVDVNEKKTKIRQRHPLPESSEQIMSRHGFGTRKKFNILLRIRNFGRKEVIGEGEVEFVHDGVLEWPDFGAGVQVECCFHSDGAVTIVENKLLFGSKDSGWEARFGQPSFIPGATFVLSPTKETTRSDRGEDEGGSSLYEELLGSTSHLVKSLRDKEDGGKVRLTSEMRIWHRKNPHCIPVDRRSGGAESVKLRGVPPLPLTFDNGYHAPSISISQNGRMATCEASEGRCTAFGSIGFTKGVHYWEVKLEHAEIGSVFIGVAEKPSGGSGTPSSATTELPRLSRWLGWGFVNFRATYSAGIERVYGSHSHNGDIIGVLLDCDTGRLSFFYDGVKYGEHILNDLGCAFSNLSPFGFNADGCGSGGAGQGAPSGLDGGSRSSRFPANGAVRPRALWPVIGLRHAGDRVTFTGKWMSSYGCDGMSTLRNVIAVDEILQKYDLSDKFTLEEKVNDYTKMPRWFIAEAFSDYKLWTNSDTLRTLTRGSASIPLLFSGGLQADLDTSALSCATASALLGLPFALLTGDKVEIKRSSGRILELSEIAEILGTMDGRLYYRLVSQKTEGGSLSEGGGRAWFWDESEVVDGGVTIIGKSKGLDIELPLLERFTCANNDLHIVYERGALVRTDLEIDVSESLGTIPFNAIIPDSDVLDCRINSSGILRYKVIYEGLRGWISSRIRGEKEQVIVERILKGKVIVADEGGVEVDLEQQVRFVFPEDASKIWWNKYKEMMEEEPRPEAIRQGVFAKLVGDGVIPGLSMLESDCILSRVLSALEDISPDFVFEEIYTALKFARGQQSVRMLKGESKNVSSVQTLMNQAAASMLSCHDLLPTAESMVARASLLRAFNRRVKVALPWIPVKPAQEGSTLYGGILGFGSSVNRVGRSAANDSDVKWVQMQSIASRVRKCRRLLFSSVKLTFLDSVVGATTTPTPLSHDEYELPREVRTVHINRIKARRCDTSSKKKYAVFSQLKHEMRGWNGAWLRRGYVAKGHGGQKRAFKVKLVGEGVNDYSGPYREVFGDAIREVEATQDGAGVLGLLDPSPNNVNEIGGHRDLLVFCSPIKSRPAAPNRDVSSSELTSIANFFRCSMGGRGELTREIEEGLSFLGRLVATACRHGIQVDLHLPQGTVWKKIAEDTDASTASVLAEIDLLESRYLNEHKELSDGNNLLTMQQRMLNSFADGMASVLPIELFSIFTGAELNEFICGNASVDVDLLMRVVEYEGYTANSQVIKYFWDTLREMTNVERKSFLQFVWARSRLPTREIDFEAPFKIIKDTKSTGDDALPSASTCFFTLTLPAYSSKDVLRKKLVFAIENGYTMESDYVTNEAEVDKGWKD